MPQKTLPGLPKPRPNIRRQVRKEHQEGDQILWSVKSFTKNDGTEYHGAFDVVTGEWSCDCPAAQFNPSKPCKHAQLAAERAVQSGDANDVLPKRLGRTTCFKCFGIENLRPMCHDDGTPAHDVYICDSCIARAQRKGQR